MGRCTLCGRYPFCNNIQENNISKNNNCKLWVKRGLNVCIKQQEKQVADKKKQ